MAEEQVGHLDLGVLIRIIRVHILSTLSEL